MNFKKIFKNKRVIFATLCFILIGLAPLMLKGLNYGMDFSGGTLIQINLDTSGNETVDPQTVITVLQNRLNSFGLKDVSVKPWGNPVSYIVIEIAETDAEEINKLQSIIGQQGHFETLFNGQTVLSGKDVVSVITDPNQGYWIGQKGTYYEWSVPFLISAEGADNLAKQIQGKCSTPQAQNCPETLYMFIDRPQNAVIVIPNEIANAEQAIPESLSLQGGTTTVKLEDLIKNSGAELIISNTITPEILEKTKDKNVIIPEGYYSESDFSTASSVVVREKTKDYWITSALNLDNIIHLTPSVTTGTPVTKPTITGSATTPEEALKEMDRIVILLKSGKLPVSVSVGSISTISPTLGKEFLTYSVYAGLLSMLVVAFCLFIRYRKPKMVIPIITTLVYEVVIVLGIAAIINWQMDLASIAGIIAAIGTGIDDQIIILDEVVRKEREEDKDVSIASKIKRAFSIVFMAAGTLFFAMVPLFFMGLGVLKGFAITTVIGVIVGIFITRPAYAAVVEDFL